MTRQITAVAYRLEWLDLSASSLHCNCHCRLVVGVEEIVAAFPAVVGAAAAGAVYDVVVAAAADDIAAVEAVGWRYNVAAAVGNVPVGSLVASAASVVADASAVVAALVVAVASAASAVAAALAAVAASVVVVATRNKLQS